MKEDLNYNFNYRRKKSDRMGENDFGGMPTEPIHKDFGSAPTFRDGVPNSFTDTIEKVSGIYENQRAD